MRRPCFVSIVLAAWLATAGAAHAEPAHSWTVLLFGPDRSIPLQTGGAQLVEALVRNVGGHYSTPWLLADQASLPGGFKVTEQLTRISSYQRLGSVDLEGAELHQYCDLRKADGQVVALVLQDRSKEWFDFLAWGSALALEAGLPPEGRAVVGAFAARVGPEESLATTEGGIRGLVAALKSRGRDLTRTEADGFRTRIRSMDTSTPLVWMDDREALVLVDRATGTPTTGALGVLTQWEAGNLLGQ